MGLVSVTTAYAGNHPSKMDVRLRETLCAQQSGMCTVSCQNNIQYNACDVETLEWGCVCGDGTTKIFNDWQFPIPFKLCRMHLLSCLHACPRSDYTTNRRGVQAVLRAEQQYQHQPEQQQQQQQQQQLNWQMQQSRMSLPDGTEGDLVDNDFDQDDYDAIEEIRMLGLHSRLEEDGSYSPFESEGHRKQILNSKKKQLHKQLWAKQRNEILVEASESGGGGQSYREIDSVDKSENSGRASKDSIAFTTMSDPAVPHSATCEAQCQTEYDCGTEYAPTYQGVVPISRGRR
ncbi:hypothetical protein BGZ98_007575 [Dissophora globulifera]|nr:hypothetical protein BGZ98_007575 [Dissophora globulifera]